MWFRELYGLEEGVVQRKVWIRGVDGWCGSEGVDNIHVAVD